ncbi:MAG TPA: hypothetical protein PKH79_15045 [Prolixibacteraceae bacterium]|nr:hypothetical protein [Prolixibacteraceae bacterium]HPS13638.1 hypothetical protein [Prolixibacteraceae bacterium]
MKLLLGEIEPSQGSINRATVKSIYIDQDYSLITPSFSVYEQAEFFNEDHLPEHEIIEIRTRAINEYSGTLLVVSHDRYFLEEIGITRIIEILKK